MMSNESVVSASALVKTFGDVCDLRGVSFKVGAGEVVGFLGPNGAGKSTAIRILAGYLGADSGAAKICGIDVALDPVAAKQHLGYLPESNPLYTEMRVQDFLKFAAGARGLSGAAARAAIDRTVEQTGLATVWGRLLGECSKGYRQRAGLAQALLHEPDLLILDEPTNGLDPLQVVEIRELVRELGREKTVLLTSHVLSEVEALAGRVVLLHQGEKVADGSLAELSSQSGVMPIQVSALGDSDSLAAACRAAGAEVVRVMPSGVTGASSWLCEWSVLSNDAVQTQATAVRALTAAGVELTAFAPQTATLESLFRALGQNQTSEVYS